VEEVRKIAPAVIRVIMSGYVSLNKLTLITSAHQYMAKPFDIAKLRDLVQRSFAAQERIVNKGLQSVATSLRSIPSLPQVHQSLLEEMEDNRTAARPSPAWWPKTPGFHQGLATGQFPAFRARLPHQQPHRRGDVPWHRNDRGHSAFTKPFPALRDLVSCRSGFAASLEPLLGNRLFGTASLPSERAATPEGRRGFSSRLLHEAGDLFCWIISRDNSPGLAGTRAWQSPRWCRACWKPSRPHRRN